MIGPYSRDNWFLMIFCAAFAWAGLSSSDLGFKVVGGLFALGVLAVAVRVPLERRAEMTSQERVTYDDERIVHYLRSGRTESIAWSDVGEVEILTTDDGPAMEDFFWIIQSADHSKGCAVSGGADGMDRLLVRLQALPGFRNEAVIDALGSTRRARFAVWERDG